MGFCGPPRALTPKQPVRALQPGQLSDPSSTGASANRIQEELIHWDEGETSHTGRSDNANRDVTALSRAVLRFSVAHCATPKPEVFLRGPQAAFSSAEKPQGSFWGVARYKTFAALLGSS